MNKRIGAIGVGLLTSAALAGCGGSGGGTSPAGGGASRAATVSLYLTDAPLTGADAVTVTIDRIEAHAVGGGLVDTGIAPMKGVNLLDLKDTEALIGNAKLSPGRYTGLRLYLSDTTITIGGKTYPLIPVTGHGAGRGKHDEATSTEADTNGKAARVLIAAPFAVADDGTITSLLLDFNVARSIVATGNGRYLLKPVIPVIRKDDAGGVEGHVALAPPPASNGDDPEVDVSVTPHGQSGPDAEENGGDADDEDKGGAFRVHALPAGTYDVTITAQGYTPVTLPNVTITPGERPDLGTITLHKPQP